MTEQSTSSSGLPTWQGMLLALLLGLGCLALTMGNPLNVVAGGLMIDTDYPNAAAAFEIFVRDAWRWPLGASPNFGGVNIFFSDGAPWFALLSKAVLSLTGGFLAFHWLIVINVLLFAVMARRLATKVSGDEPVRWLITVLLVFTLIMLVRMIGAQHIALGAYWVVLWAMCCVPVLNEASRGWRRWEFLAAAGIAILTHAYLGAMAITIILVMLAFERRWMAALAALLWPALLLYCVGVFEGSHSTTQGAKDYSLDLVAYTKSLGWGITGNLYDIREAPQGDAILYLGTGAWGLLFASLIMALLSRRLSPLSQPVLGTGWRRQRLFRLLVACFALVLYAMTFDLRIAGHVLMSLEIPGLFDPLYERFRVTGRFAAPLAFLLIVLAGLWWGAWRAGARRWRVMGWWIVAFVAVALQTADAWYAGTRSLAPDWVADADRQRGAVASVLEGQKWSGRVYKAVSPSELEHQRLLDFLLVKQGARHFEVAHGARLSAAEVARRSGYAEAQAGDLVILVNGDPGPECQRSATLKTFTLCLL
nr:hypothetical protein [uncultured Halomonas sp.]